MVLQNNIDRAGEYLNRAESMLAAGFTSEAARKDAMDYCNRAFDGIKDRFHAALNYGHAGAHGLPEEQAKKLYWAIPDCWVWKAAKHGVMFAHFPDICADAQKVADLRAKCKAAGLVAKAPSKTAQRVAADLEKAMTCQVCGRPIQSNGGVVAHHGYQRPGMGWQTDSCMGARIVPFEVSRDMLGKYIAMLDSRLESLADHAAAVQAESVDLFRSWKTRKNPGQWPAQYDSHQATYNRRSFDQFKAENPAAFEGNRSATFDSCKAIELAQIESDRVMVTSYRREAKGRFDAWPGPTHRFNAANKEWESINV